MFFYLVHFRTYIFLPDNVIVKTAGALDYETQPTCNLEVTCSDGLLSSTGTYTVIVDNTVGSNPGLAIARN